MRHDNRSTKNIVKTAQESQPKGTALLGSGASCDGKSLRLLNTLEDKQTVIEQCDKYSQKYLH